MTLTLPMLRMLRMAYVAYAQGVCCVRAAGGV
jgi:hypothetical protein